MTRNAEKVAWYIGYFVGWAYLLWFLFGCHPVPPVPPDPVGAGTCETAAANLQKLGGCGLDLAAFPAECEGATRAEAAVSALFPSGCLSVASTCDAARLCRPVTVTAAGYQ